MKLNFMSRIMLATGVEYFFDCQGMQRAVDQRRTGRFACPHADGIEHRGPGSHFANRQRGQPGGGLGHPEDCGRSGQRPDPAAVAIQPVQSQSERGLSSENRKCESGYRSLPALLQAAHISDLALSARITAAVNPILTTLNSFSSLIPGASSSALARTARQRRVVPRPQDLKKQWNLQVCAPSRNAALDAALSERGLEVTSGEIRGTSSPVLRFQFSEWGWSATTFFASECRLW